MPKVTIDAVQPKRGSDYPAPYDTPLAGREAPGEEHVDDLGGIGDGQVHASGMGPFRGRVAGLLPQFAPGAGPGVLARIETKVNRHSFYTWFRPTAMVADGGTQLTIRVPNPLFKDWLTKHYSGVLA